MADVVHQESDHTAERFDDDIIRSGGFKVDIQKSVKPSDSFREPDQVYPKPGNDVIRTSSFKEQIQNSGSRTHDNIFDHTPSSVRSPRRRPGFAAGRRSVSPGKSPDRSVSESPRPRRERSFLRSTSPDKMFRKPSIWAQWENSKQHGDEYLQEYNVRQMTGLYGKDLSGKAELAQEWYRANGLDRSKTQSEALGWLYSEAVQSATAPVSQTPRGTQTEPADGSGRSSSTNSRFVGVPYRNKEMRTREQLKEEKNLNKLSHRHRVQKTPGVESIRQRESQFTNDAIVTERRRTRFKDIIPQYDASEDRHCKAYFKRKDVQKLITVTRSREATPAGSVTPGVTPRVTPRPTPGATPF